MTQRLRRHPFLALFDGADPNSSTAGRNVDDRAHAGPVLHERPVGPPAGRAARRAARWPRRDDARPASTWPTAWRFGRPATDTERDQAVALPGRLPRPAGRRRRRRPGTPRRLGQPGADRVRQQRVPLTSIEPDAGPGGPRHAIPPRPRLVATRCSLRAAMAGSGSLALGGDPRRAVRRPTSPAAAQRRSPGAAGAPFRPQGQAGDPPLHDRRRLARRLVRPQAEADADHGKTSPSTSGRAAGASSRGTSSGPTGRPARRPVAASRSATCSRTSATASTTSA